MYAHDPIKSSATLLPPWIVDRVPPPVPALFPRRHLYLHLPAVPVDVHVHPILECLLISECVICEIRRKRRLSPLCFPHPYTIYISYAYGMI